MRQLWSRTPVQGVVLLVLCVALVFLIKHQRHALQVMEQETRAIAPRSPMTPALLAQRIKMPPGFAISLYITDLPGVRMLRFTSAGDLLASRPAAGEILLLSPDGEGRPARRRVLLSRLHFPHGIDIHDGWLYVAEGNAIFRVRLDEKTGTVSGEPSYIVRGIPEGGGHSTRSIRIGPDNHLYLSIGSSCNVCKEKDPRRAAIVRYDLDGGNETLFATGLRNSVGMAFQPDTGRLYATDNGRDLLGDDFPPCELNLIEQGQFYGWPYASGNRVPDPDFGSGHEAEIAASRPPVHGFLAHNAPLGITFARGAHFPPAYADAAFVALHGSWNRSTKSGYKVVALHFTNAGVREEDFITGFMVDEHVVGRPVDVAVGPDGALYVSDDYAGVIYRVSYRP